LPTDFMRNLSHLAREFGCDDFSGWYAALIKFFEPL
jgi:hypothetical protein